MEVPNAPAWRQAVVGALLELTYRRNWEEIGVTPQDAADLMLECFSTHIFGGCMFAGMVAAFAGDTPPAGWLLCDGASLDRNDYPRLFAAIGYVWGGSGDNFNVPDFRYRALVGAGTWTGQPNIDLGDTLGEPDHVLTVPEIPSHRHALLMITALAQLGVGAPVIIPDPLIPTHTSYEGGGEAHNNMQPSAGIHWIIST